MDKGTGYVIQCVNSIDDKIKKCAILNPEPKDIENAVKNHEVEHGYLDKVLYNQCLIDAMNINFNNVTKSDIKGVVKVFLVNWGRMGRNINKKTVDIWADDLLAAISKHREDLETFRKLKLENINLTNYENQIITCYRDFNRVNHMGRAGVSKVFHLFAPEFFPILDSNIANLLNYNCELKIRNSAEDYYNYMCAIQHLLKSNLKTCSSLAKKYNKKTKLRIVDNYLWMISPNRADP